MVIRVVGDSKVNVDWANGQFSIHPLSLHHWKEHVQNLIQCFERITFSHIYCVFTQQADALSKKVVGDMKGFLFYEEFLDQDILNSRSYYVL